MGFTTKSDKKGFGFEYTVSSMFQNQGYLTRRGVPLQYGNANQDATDIDVMGIMFTFPFQIQRIICDCKNKTKAKPYERIFWAKGLGEFVKATKVFVALNKTQDVIIKFANTGGVKILTNDIIDEYGDAKPSYGLADPVYYEQYEKVIVKVAKSDVFINQIHSRVKKLYLYENPYLALNIAIADLCSLSNRLRFHEKNDNDTNASMKYLICELSVVVAIQLLSICSDVLGLPEGSRRQQITSKLTFGDLEPQTIKNIMQDAKNLANEIVKSSVPKSVAPKEVDFGEITPPAYTDSFIGLVERALARPQMYLSMPQLLDFMLFEEGLKGRDISDEELRSIFGYDSSDERMKASRNIISFIREFTGIDWKVVWNRPDGRQYSPTYNGDEGKGQVMGKTKNPSKLNDAKNPTIGKPKQLKIEDLQNPIDK